MSRKQPKLNLHKLNWRDKLVAADLDIITKNGIPIKRENPGGRFVRACSVLGHTSSVRGGSLSQFNPRNRMASSSESDEERSEQGGSRTYRGQQFVGGISGDVLALCHHSGESSESQENPGYSRRVRRDDPGQPILRDNKELSDEKNQNASQAVFQ